MRQPTATVRDALLSVEKAAALRDKARDREQMELAMR